MQFQSETACRCDQPHSETQVPPSLFLENAVDVLEDGTDMRWFAGMAMQAIINKVGVPTSEAMREEIALWSFRMAEDMLKADARLHHA